MRLYYSAEMKGSGLRESPANVGHAPCAARLQRTVWANGGPADVSRYRGQSGARCEWENRKRVS